MSTNTGDLYINIRSDVTELKKGLALANKQLSSFDKTMQRSATGVMNFAKSAVGIYAVGAAFKEALSAGFSYNTQLETTQQSITGLLVATSALVDENGNAITQQELYNTAMGESASILKDLQKINAQTPVTLNETAQIYKTMLPSMRQVGASQKDLMELTKNLAVASGVAGIKTAQLLAGIDGLADGTVLANSELGRFLRALNLSNEELKNSKDVVGLLNESLGKLKGELTMDMQLSTLAEAWGSMWGEITSGLWEASKGWIATLIEFFNWVKERVQQLPLFFKAMGMAIEDVWKLMLAGMRLAYEEFMDVVKTTIDYLTSFTGMVSISYNADLEDARAAYQNISDSLKTGKEHLNDLIKAQGKLPKSASTVASSLGATSSKDAAKASKSRIKAAKDESKARIKAEKDWLKAVNDVQAKAEKMRKDAMEDFADYSQDLLSGVFDSLLNGDLQGAFDGVFQSLLGTLSDFVAEALVQTLILGQAFATTAIAHAAAQTTWVGLAAMTAAMIALGLAANSSGGSSQSYSMPSYSQVSQGSSGEAQSALNSEGAYLSLVDYNAILEIAQYNQSDFNSALEEYNNLVSEAKQITDAAVDSMRKWGKEFSSYDEILTATQSVGSWDSLNEFWDSMASNEDTIDYLSKTVKDLEINSNLAGMTINDLNAYIKYLIALGDPLSMAQANRAAELGIAKIELADKQEDMFNDVRDAAEAAAEACKEAARAARELRESIVGLTADWLGSIEGSLLLLDSAVKETGITGVTSDNFLDRFKTASSSGGFTQEDLENWAQLSDALKNYASALDEKLQLEMDALNLVVNFYTDILKKIQDAYTGSLSYLNSFEKISYLENLGAAQLASGNSQGYFDSLYKQLEYEKKMSVTREEYAVNFDKYIEALQDAEHEKTTDDVVETLESIYDRLGDVQTSIEKSSYQGVI